MWMTLPGLVTEFPRAPDNREDGLPYETTPEQIESFVFKEMQPPSSSNPAHSQPLWSRRRGTLGGPEPMSVGEG